MIIYGDKRSGNCYKLQLICGFLQRPYQWHDIDILAGDTRKKWFLDKNPLGKIPLLELPDGRLLTESNAILNFIATGSTFLPSDSFELAQVQQWQFFEQYSHEPYIAVARFIQHYLGLPEARKAEYLAKQEAGNKALLHMDRHLSDKNFLVADRLTTADISLFAYTHVAHQGGFDLCQYPNIEQWLQRIKDAHNFVPMDEVS